MSISRDRLDTSRFWALQTDWRRYTAPIHSGYDRDYRFQVSGFDGVEIDGALAWRFPAVEPVSKFVSAHLNGAENRPRKCGNTGMSVKIGAEEARKKMIKTVPETAAIGTGWLPALDRAISARHQTLSTF